MLIRKICVRGMLAFILIYIPVSELGATGSYSRMVYMFLVLAITAWYGWLERENTMIDLINNSFDDGCRNE